MRLFPLLLAALCAFTGCTTSHVLINPPRPATDPAAMKVYLNPPKKYEVIALVNADNIGNPSVTGQGKMNAVMNRMKKEAAKLGANGILLTGIGATGSVSMGVANTNFTGNGAITTGTGINMGGVVKTGSCHAIWVTEE